MSIRRYHAKLGLNRFFFLILNLSTGDVLDIDLFYQFSTIYKFLFKYHVHPLDLSKCYLCLLYFYNSINPKRLIACFYKISVICLYLLDIVQFCFFFLKLFRHERIGKVILITYCLKFKKIVSSKVFSSF